MGLSYEQLYSMDTSGFIHLPAVLSAADLLAARAAAAGSMPSSGGIGSSRLLEHPVLHTCLDRLLGGGSDTIRESSPVPDNLNIDTAPVGWRLDTQPRLATSSPACRGSSGGGRWLHDGGGSGNADSHRLRYATTHGVLLCQGVTALWVLDVPGADKAAAAPLTVIPASHRSRVPTPPEVLAGEKLPSTALAIPLCAGDLLIVATTTLWRFHCLTSQLLLCDYAMKNVWPSGGYEPPVPAAAASTAWLDELSPAARAIVAPRLLGKEQAVCALSDGVSTTTTDTPPPRLSSLLGLTSFEEWEWDLNGWLVIKGVMGADWLAAANAAVAACSAEAEYKVDVALSHQTADGVWPSHTSRWLRGGGSQHRMLNGLTELPHPHCEPFRAMIAHPPVLQKLNTLLGFGFHESGPP
jgi:hypothetical protein